VHHGRHFGRTVHALCTVHALLTNGILHVGELSDQPDDSFTHEQVIFILIGHGRCLFGLEKEENIGYLINFFKWCLVSKTASAAQTRILGTLLTWYVTL